MKSPALAILLFLLLTGSCNRGGRQTLTTTSMDTSSSGGLSDSAMSILRAYDEKRLNADAAARAFLDELARSKSTTGFGLQVDDQLRAALTREMARRRGK